MQYAFLENVDVGEVLNLAPALLRDQKTADIVCRIILSRFRLSLDTKSNSQKILKCVHIHYSPSTIHPAILKELLEILEIYEYPEIIIHAIPSLIGGMASSDTVSSVSDCFKTLLSMDRSLLVPIMGSLMEMPLSPILTSELNELSQAALNVVDENDIPAVIKVMMSTLGPNIVGYNSILTLRLQIIHFSPSTESLAFEVIAASLKVNKLSSKLFLKAITSSAVPLIRLDMFILLYKLDEDNIKRRRNIIGATSSTSSTTTVKQVLTIVMKNGTLSDLVLMDTIQNSTFPVWSKYAPSLLLLCRLLAYNVGSISIRMTRDKFATGVRTAFILLFDLHQNLRLSIIVSLLSMMQRSAFVNSKSSEIVVSIAGDVIVGLARFKPQLLAPFSQHLEEMLLTYHYECKEPCNDDFFVLHRLSESVARLAAIKPGAANALLITVQKQLLSGHHCGDATHISGVILALHLVQCRTLEFAEENTVISWILRVISSSSKLILYHAFDFIESCPRMSTDQAYACLTKAILPLMHQVGLISTLSMHNTASYLSDLLTTHEYQVSFAKESIENQTSLTDANDACYVLHLHNKISQKDMLTNRFDLRTLISGGFNINSFVSKYHYEGLNICYFTSTLVRCFLVLLHRLVSEYSTYCNLVDILISWTSVGLCMPELHIDKTATSWWESFSVDDVIYDDDSQSILSSLDYNALETMGWCCVCAIDINASIANLLYSSITGSSNNQEIEEIVLDHLVSNYVQLNHRLQLIMKSNTSLEGVFKGVISEIVEINPFILIQTVANIDHIHHSLQFSVIEYLRNSIDGNCSTKTLNTRSPRLIHRWSIGSMNLSLDAIQSIYNSSSSSSSSSSYVKKPELTSITLLQNIASSAILNIVLIKGLTSIRELHILRLSNTISNSVSLNRLGRDASLAFSLIKLVLESSRQIDKAYNKRSNKYSSTCDITTQLIVSMDTHAHNPGSEGGRKVEVHIQQVYSSIFGIWDKIVDHCTACLVVEVLSILTSGLMKAHDVAMLCVDSLHTVYSTTIDSNSSLVTQSQSLASSILGTLYKSKSPDARRLLKVIQSGFILTNSNELGKDLSCIRFMLLNASLLSSHLHSLVVVAALVTNVADFVFGDSLADEASDRSALELVMTWSGATSNRLHSTGGTSRSIPCLELDTLPFFIAMLLDLSLVAIDEGQPAVTLSDPYLHIVYPISTCRRLVGLFNKPWSHGRDASLRLILLVLKRCCVLFPLIKRKLLVCIEWRAREGCNTHSTSTNQNRNSEPSHDPHNIQVLSRVCWEISMFMQAIEVFIERIRPSIIRTSGSDVSHKRKRGPSPSSTIRPVVTHLSRLILQVESFRDWFRETRDTQHLTWNETNIAIWSKAPSIISKASGLIGDSNEIKKYERDPISITTIKNERILPNSPSNINALIYSSTSDSEGEASQFYVRTSEKQEYKKDDEIETDTEDEGSDEKHMSFYGFE